MRSRLIDTNVLVYRFDPRDPLKQQIASRVLRDGLTDDSLILPHQGIVEFVAAVSRPRTDLDGAPLLDQADALREAESLMLQFPMVYPNRAALTTAMRGVATYRMSWFAAHLWACAETFGIPEILSEDFEHGRHYGSVRINNPFLAGSETLQELPPLYSQSD
jgi:predicted nucleic acid-binding protein